MAAFVGPLLGVLGSVAGKVINGAIDGAMSKKPKKSLADQQQEFQALQRFMSANKLANETIRSYVDGTERPDETATKANIINPSLTGIGIEKYKCKKCHHHGIAPGGHLHMDKHGHLHHHYYCAGCGIMDDVKHSIPDSKAILQFIQTHLGQQIHDIAELNHPGMGDVMTKLLDVIMKKIYGSSNPEEVVNTYEGKGFGINSDDLAKLQAMQARSDGYRSPEQSKADLEELIRINPIMGKFVSVRDDSHGPVLRTPSFGVMTKGLGVNDSDSDEEQTGQGSTKLSWKEFFAFYRKEGKSAKEVGALWQKYKKEA